MKSIKCELCGGTNFIKQNGMFVCQDCNTKYSIEEAKKLYDSTDTDTKDEVGAAVISSVSTSDQVQDTQRIDIDSQIEKALISNKKSKITIPILILIAIITIEVLFVHPGIALNTFYAIFSPLALIVLLKPSTNPFTGVYKPVDYYSEITMSMHLERATRFSLIDKTDPVTIDYYGVKALRSEYAGFIIIIVIICLELRLLLKCYRTTNSNSYCIILCAIAISVLIWAEVLYLALGYVNAIVSFVITFVVFLVSYGIMARKTSDK